ncbi:hypothetical protein FLONG3_1205 [Fusarium longipes]|uniref:Apple domain-containing protein n=1 Tax=Fusarium longipes TaxID=694270 RepID=A0A395T7P9_9HYPO|nr:hypothetical protein FLONG3_1205 [Fusarium longipes]
MRTLEFQWTLWALLPFLSTSAAAPESCSEMGDTYDASVYRFNVDCNTIGSNPATYAYYSLGDTFASCIQRCDLDEVCIAVNYQHFTGDCDLVAAFTQSQPSSDYDLAVKASVLTSPTTSTSLTTDAMPTTDSTTLVSTASTSDTLSTSDFTSLPSTATTSEEVSTSAYTSLSETASTSDAMSTSDAISTSDEVSTSDSTTLLPTVSTSDSASPSSPSSTIPTLDLTSTTVDSTSMLSTSILTSSLSTETLTSEPTMIFTTSDSFVSSSMSLSDSTTVEDVTVSSLTSSVLTFLTLSTSEAVAESSTITSASFSAPSTSESTSTPPTSSTTESVTIVETASTIHSTASDINMSLSSDDSTTKTPETTVLTDIATATIISSTCTTLTTLTDTVTSVTYVTVDSSQSVVTTCVPVTLVYSPCGCEHETYPTVDMVTVTSPCSTPGAYGKDTTTLTVPKACETLTSDGQSAVQYPSGWVGSQTYSGHGSYYLAQPTAGPQTDSQPDSKKPSQVVTVLASRTISEQDKASAGRAKATNGPQKATEEPSPEAGPEGNHQSKATPDQSIPSVSQFAASPQSSVHYEQVPAKESNAPETLSSSWTTHYSNHDASISASKTGSTDEIAQSNVPSEPGAKGSTPMTVSGANRPRCVLWAVIGLVLMFY